MTKQNIILVISFLLIVVFLYIVYGNKSISKDYDLKVYFFNAGKADSILISKNEKYILIDTGEESLSDDILRYFENNGITKLEYLIITHFDKDHVGSASKIIENIEIGEVLQSNSPKESEYYTNYLTALQQKNITPKTVTGNYELTFEDLQITVNGPEKIYTSNESNNSSLIVSLTYNENKFLFTGDAQNDRIKDYLSENEEAYDFLKIPYHGNYQKQLKNLIEAVTPKYGAMTCSSSEGCEEETQALLESNNVEYYMTKNGAISVLSNGKDIIIKQ